jgi:hypothetical protein
LISAVGRGELNTSIIRFRVPVTRSLVLLSSEASKNWTGSISPLEIRAEMFSSRVENTSLIMKEIILLLGTLQQLKKYWRAPRETLLKR